MYGILKEDLYLLSTSFALASQRGAIYTLQEMRNKVDDFTNTFVPIPKGTKFIQVHHQQESKGGYYDPGELVSTWESEDRQILGKDSIWAAKHLEQYEEKFEQIEISDNEFRINIYHSSQNRNIHIYRMSPFNQMLHNQLGVKKYVLCNNTKNLPVWTTIEEKYYFKDDAEQLRLNKLLDLIKIV